MKEDDTANTGEAGLRGAVFRPSAASRRRTGTVRLGEASSCSDDRFNSPVCRFPAIEEDEPPCRLLCNENPAAK